MPLELQPELRMVVQVMVLALKVNAFVHADDLRVERLQVFLACPVVLLDIPDRIEQVLVIGRAPGVRFTSVGIDQVPEKDHFHVHQLNFLRPPLNVVKHKVFVDVFRTVM